jgi:REP element-mobilizing transposase RayT
MTLDEYGYEIFEENEFPLAYLLTFRTFGTWLHGDERESVQRNGMNIFGTPRIKSNERLEKWMLDEMKQPPFILSDAMRKTVEAAVRELCERRGFGLSAVNVRTNHAHAVVSAWRKPERIIDALKANATKMLREEKLVSIDTRIWSRGGSRRYLWKPRHVSAAVEYTLYGHGDIPFEIDD